MPVSEVFASESFNELTVVSHILHFLRKLEENIVLLSLLQLHFHCHVLRLVVLDLFDDSLSILLLKVVQVPLTVLFCESVSVVPKAEALFIALLKDFELGNVCMLNVQNFFVVLELLDLVVVLIELLLNFCELSKGLRSSDFWFSKYLAIKGFDLFAD